MVIRISSCKSVSLFGLHGDLVNVEANIADGMSRFTIVGLPDTSVNESRERVLTAFKCAGVYLSECHITVNLGPASVQKRGSHYDLAIATAVMGAYGVIDKTRTKNVTFLGELGLDGRIHPIRGVLPAVKSAVDCGITEVVVANANVEEACLIQKVSVQSFGHLAEVINHFGGSAKVPGYEPVSTSYTDLRNATTLDMRDVLGQADAKYALEVAAAGGHNVFMQGPPGTGKTMLASRFSSILPPLTQEESVEVTSIHSLSGRENVHSLITIPPFEAPHHTATAPAIIGGGSGTVRPGSVSRAHCGVLFLDEAPEFSPRVLQTLRQPLESGEVHVDRANGSAVFPARFQLILASNPCPCGMYGAQGKMRGKCKCTSLERRRYMSRLSGPLLDRVDIFTEVTNAGGTSLQTSGSNDTIETTSSIQERVQIARERAKTRWKNTPWSVNSQVPGSYLRKVGKNQEVIKLLHDSVQRGIISLRGADRALRVAYTVADLANASGVELLHVAKSLELKRSSFDDLL